MHGSVRALLTGILDYAGLFPPAKLPLDQALHLLLRYRTTPENWMLGRFICPAARLGELEAFRDDIAALSSPLVISALGRVGKDAKEFFEGVRADLADIAHFRAGFGEKVEVDVYETKVPAGLFDPPKEHPLYALIGTTAFLIETSGPPLLTPFFEPPSAQSESVRILLDTLAADRAAPEAARRQRCRPPGFKLRCGGLEAAAFPSPQQIAFTLVHARERGIPLKFTAGLHHPLRHFDAGVQAKMHGFLNVYFAGILANTYNLTLDHVAVILQDEESSHFVFEDGLRWKEASVPLSQIVDCRTHRLLSFGSCSFDEPRADLRKLELIP